MRPVHTCDCLLLLEAFLTLTCSDLHRCATGDRLVVSHMCTYIPIVFVMLVNPILYVAAYWQGSAVLQLCVYLSSGVLVVFGICV